MKNILIIGFIALISFSKNAKAQTGVPDTLVYLQSITANKANYIGQPFSALLDDLQIQIKFFSPFASIHYDKNKETSTSFSFYFPQDGHDDFYLTYPKLEVFWQTALGITQSDALWESNNGGGWASTVATFYANGIIKYIRIRE